MAEIGADATGIAAPSAAADSTGASRHSARWQDWDGTIPMQEAPESKMAAAPSDWLTYLNPSEFATEVWRTLRRADEIAASSEGRSLCNAAHVALVLVTETLASVGAAAPWGADIHGIAMELRRQMKHPVALNQDGSVPRLLQAARAQRPRGPPGPVTLEDLCAALFEPASGVASTFNSGGLTAVGIKSSLRVLSDDGSTSAGSSSQASKGQQKAGGAKSHAEALRDSADPFGSFTTGTGNQEGEGSSEEQSALARFGTDLVAMAAQGMLDTVHGREKEVDRILRVLSRRNKPNVCLLGHPGVGKTAVVEEVARRIHEGKVPSQLSNCKRLIQLSLGSLVGGTRYRGDFERRMQTLLQELKSLGEECVLFIDELHMAMGAGETEKGGSMDAANLLKPALARGEFRCIGATTTAEYQRFIQNKDKAFERRFVVLDILEPSEAAAVEMLQASRPSFEKHHGVKVLPATVEAAVRGSRVLKGRFLPDRALDVLDDAATLAAVEAAQQGDFVPVCRPEHVDRATQEATRKAVAAGEDGFLSRLWKPWSRL
mmetsp:Transcript_43147/g.101371  ORF Transcript_43147/g.101371 Transcript_43147/m.101371 type:complete len:546 (-) Transcript_43147:60-1697(-)